MLISKPMSRQTRWSVPVMGVLASLVLAIAVVSVASNASAQGYTGPKRIDFDERLIKGQTAKAGSVYIFDRQKLGMQQLVNRQRRFRAKTIRTVFEGYHKE